MCGCVDVGYQTKCRARSLTNHLQVSTLNSDVQSTTLPWPTSRKKTPRKKSAEAASACETLIQLLLTSTAGKNLRYYIQRVKDLPEGVSKNSVKTGTSKQGRKSKEAQKRKRKRDAQKIKAARAAAEAKWGAFLNNGKPAI